VLHHHCCSLRCTTIVVPFRILNHVPIHINHNFAKPPWEPRESFLLFSSGSLLLAPNVRGERKDIKLTGGSHAFRDLLKLLPTPPCFEAYTTTRVVPKTGA